MSSEDLDKAEAATAAQLRELYECVPEIVLTGSLGRAAIYESFKYPAPPLSMHDPTNGYRDFDVMMVPDKLFDHGHLFNKQHPLHLGLDGYASRSDEHATMRIDMGHRMIDIDVNPTVLEPRERKFLGVSVLTFCVGTQLRVEKLVQPLFVGNEKYDNSAREFATFALSIRRAHSDEFPHKSEYGKLDSIARKRLIAFKLTKLLS